MALGDFFRINMPYGIRKSEDKKEWFAFNREYKPLGFNTYETVKYEDYPIFTKYKALTEAKLLKIAGDRKDATVRNEQGEIVMIFLYNDASNPKDTPKYWETYFEKLKILASLNEDKND